MKNTYNGRFGLFDSLKKLLLLVLLFGGFSTFAQTTYQVGTGTGTNAYFPLYTYYGYTYSEQIYLASELTAQGATAGTISKIRFYYASAGTTTASDDSWEVFVGNTSQSSFSSTSNYVTSNNMTSVYSGSVTYPSTGGNWMEISLSTPFFWDGVSNLVVGVDQNEPGYDYPYAYFGHTSTSTLRSIQYYNDGVNPNPASPPTGNTSSYGIANAQFVIAAASACTGTPAAATALASDTSTCANNPVTLSLGTSYNFTGMTYQWQSSSNGTTWTNITGATGPTYSASQSSATYYQCIITCTNSSSSVTSSSVYVSMNAFYDCYCPANSNYGTSGDYYASIYNVTFNTLNNSTSVPASSPYYTNYAPVGNNTTTVFTGFSYTFSLNTKYSYTGVWIDWDQNGTYGTNEYYPVAYNSSTTPTTYSITIPVPLGAAVGQTGMRVRSEAYFYTLGSGDPCTQLYYGETEDYTINVTNPPTDDAGIAAINSPSFPACTLDSNICVTIQNFGTDTLFSCAVMYSVNNGASYTTYNWTGMIPPQADDTVCTQIGTATFNIGDNLIVVATDANGTTGSTYTANDTLTINNMNVSLQGVYAIPGDYATINDAIDDMNIYGVCADVVFNLASGTYNESMLLNNIAGMGPNATVTFKSAANDTAAVTVQFTGNFDTNYVVKLNQGSWFRFKNITFSNLSTSYGRVFEITGNSTNNIIDSNRVMTVNNSTTSNYNALVYSPGSLDNNNTYSNNSFERGSYSLYLYGVTNAAGSYEEGTIIKNNTISDVYYGALWLYYQKGIEVSGNTITSNSGYQYGYGMYIYYCSTVNLSKNHLYSQPTGVWPYYGIYSYQSGGSSAGPTSWTNNIVVMPSNAYVGLYQYYTSYANIAHNTVIVRDGNNTNSRAYMPYYSDLYFANNNIFVNYAGGYNVYGYNANAFELNHNAYFGTGANPFYIQGPTYSSFEAYQNASGGLEANSVWTNPNFADTTMGILCNDTLDEAGTPLTYVTDDIDNLNRNTSTPDIGAREFVSLANFALGSDTICGTSFEVVGPVSNASWTVNSVASTGTSVMLSTGTTPTTFNVDISFSSVCSVDTNGNQIPVTDAGTFRLIPSAELASALHLCADDVATLSPGGGANATYLWFPTNETSSSIQIDGGGIYSVTKDEEGCMSQATIAVSESDGVDLQNAEVCAGDLPYQVDATIVGGQSYTWSEGSSTATVDLNTTGVYFVTVTDNQGCSSSDSIFFEAIDIPTVGFTETHSGYVYYFNSGNSANVGSSASYAWSFGDGSAISTDANPTHQYPWASPSTPAVYVTTLTVTNACGTSDKTMEIMPDPLGVNELGNAINYNVYPNPSNGFVNVEFTGTVAEQASLRVMDISGRLVSESSANTNDIVTLNLSSVASGTYILEVSIDGAVSQTRISIQ